MMFFLHLHRADVSSLDFAVSLVSPYNSLTMISIAELSMCCIKVLLEIARLQHVQ